MVAEPLACAVREAFLHCVEQFPKMAMILSGTTNLTLRFYPQQRISPVSQTDRFIDCAFAKLLQTLFLLSATF